MPHVFLFNQDQIVQLDNSNGNWIQNSLVLGRKVKYTKHSIFIQRE